MGGSGGEGSIVKNKSPINVNVIESFIRIIAGLILCSVSSISGSSTSGSVSGIACLYNALATPDYL